MHRSFLTHLTQFPLAPQQTRFNRLSDQIIGRIDDMGGKIDALEQSINELMDQQMDR